MFSTRHLGLAAASLALFASTSTAQVEISSLSITEGTTGTEVQINGSGFGDKKAKVRFVDEEGDRIKKTSLKVAKDGTSDDMIVFEIRKAVAGSYFVQVKVKGEDEVTYEGDMFTVRSPSLAGDSVTGDPKSEQTVGADFLGRKKPKARVGGKRTKVTDFGPSSEEGSSESLTFKVPKKLANGVWPLEIDNKVGMDVDTDAVTVENSNAKLGKESFKGVADGKKVNAKGKRLGASEVAGRWIIVATKGKGGKARQFNINLPVSTAGTTIVGGDSIADFITFVIGTVESQDVWGGNNWSATINAIDENGRVSGSFEGTLEPQSKGAEGNVEVSGNFIVEPDSPAP